MLVNKIGLQRVKTNRKVAMKTNGCQNVQQDTSVGLPADKAMVSLLCQSKDL